jgi:indole-3-glycerol phosphate synthase
MKTGQPGKKLEEFINESNPVTHSHDKFTTE